MGEARIMVPMAVSATNIVVMDMALHRYPLTRLRTSVIARNSFFVQPHTLFKLTSWS